MKVHLVGICGTGMGALAGLLKTDGHDVRGSDDHVYPPMSDQLRALDIPLFEGFRPENLDWAPDRVVVGNVCRKDHIEVVAAQERGIELTSFPALLEELFLRERHSVVVAGTHGKTTTTSLLAFALSDAGRDPSFLVGGVPVNFGAGYRLGQGPVFVVEGDEYDSAFFDKGSKFLHYRPRTALLTGIELDHVDIFDSFAKLRATFSSFVALLPEDGLLIAAASSAAGLEVAREARARLETYAVGKRAVAGVKPTWHAEIHDGVSASRTSFTVTHDDKVYGHFDVELVGEHNLENALAVIAAGASLGLTRPELDRALRRFAGVKRRQEVRGIASGVTVIDDYAHHPTAVRETLAALRRRAGRGRLIALYEPRSATSRRSTFQKEFADAFASADEVVVTKLWKPEAIPPAERFDPEKLAADLRSSGVAARMLPDVDAVVSHVTGEVHPGDVIAVFTTGDMNGIHDRLLDKLGDVIRQARVEEMPRVRQILESVGLKSNELTDDRALDVLVVVAEGKVVGTVTIEIHDDAAVLHSLAVDGEWRGHGFGWLLADHGVMRARDKGAKRLYLLTETASDFFAEKFGFRAIDRATVDAAVTASRHFRESARGAVAMRRDL